MAPFAAIIPHMPGSKTTPFILPNQLPVMVLDRCYLLPGGVQPLYIFEERYRRMLDHALHTQRMFCLGDRKRNGEIRSITTAGVIATSVLSADGSSQMVLHGIQRVRITGWIQEEPFLIATIKPFETLQGPEDQVAELSRQTMGLLDHFDIPEITENLALLQQLLKTRNDPEFICDMVTSLAVVRSSARRAVLEEPELLRRFEILLTELNRSAEG